MNTNFEKDSSSEPEAFVTKVPAEEKIQDGGSLNTADVHEGVEQVDESENIIQQNPDGEHYSQEIHTGPTEDEILKNVSFNYISHMMLLLLHPVNINLKN